MMRILSLLHALAPGHFYESRKSAKEQMPVFTSIYVLTGFVGIVQYQFLARIPFDLQSLTIRHFNDGRIDPRHASNSQEGSERRKKGARSKSKKERTHYPSYLPTD
jgi:hypothetical protein